MSIEQMEPEAGLVEQDVNGSGMGGTNASDVQAVGGDEDQLEGSEVAEGESPEGEAGERKSRASAAESAEAAELRRELDEARAKVEDAERIAELVRRDPERMKQLRAWHAADQGEPGSSSLESEFASAVNETYERPEDRTAIEKFMSPVFRELKALRAELSGMRPALDHVASKTTAAEFDESLTKNGISPAVRKTEEWRKFLAGEMQDRQFQRERSVSGSRAARNAANAWHARQSRAVQRERTDAVRDGRLGGASLVNGNGAKKVIVQDPSDPDKWIKRLEARQRDPSAQFAFKK